SPQHNSASTNSGVRGQKISLVQAQSVLCTIWSDRSQQQLLAHAKQSGVPAEVDAVLEQIDSKQAQVYAWLMNTNLDQLVTNAYSLVAKALGHEWHRVLASYFATHIPALTTFEQVPDKLPGFLLSHCKEV